MNTKQDREKHAKQIQKSVETGKIKLNNKEVDVSQALKMWSTKEYRADNINEININNFEKSQNKCKFTILVDGSDKVMFNRRYKTDDTRYLQKKICVLNFASSKNPGGGFITGAMAQEEALCHSSNLYDILSKNHISFYEYNREHLNKSLYSDGIIFTKNVLFFNDKDLQLVDVITCPAPNAGVARRNGVSEEEIECTMSRRIEQILKVVIANNVRTLALGAFGCGVFGNDPYKVANIMATVLVTRGLAEYFDEIIFPMNGTMGDNVKAFNKVFKNL